ncbi:MAG: NDP-sugar synthase, partial [Candidatus Sericytochromatia bacterium]
MRAVIIAGGSGTRLRPLTYNTPKPMVPLFNKPFLQYQMELLKRHGITEIIVNLHYLSNVIEDYFGDGSALGLKIFYSREEKALGTAGAVKLAEEFFDDEPLVVLNGDILTDVDLSAILAFHKEKKARATITMIRVTDPTAYGLIFTDGEGQVTRFLEKPSWDEATVDTVNAGIYVLDPSVFRYVPRNEAYSFERG